MIDVFMKRAIELAKLGRGRVEPNPMVGCVIINDDEVVGEGYHEKFGGPHAEVNALAAAGDAARGATAIVTLEPCCHHGKTPPCTGALIAAGVANVIVGAVDPFAQVDGGGIELLRRAGIEVEVGCLQQECEDLIAPFSKRVRTNLPWVTAKWAMTIDGRIATRTGSSQWITGEAARADVHRTRAASDGILIGMGTVRADNPQLTARPIGATPNTTLHRIVLCRKSVPSLNCRLMQTIDQAPLHLIIGPDCNSGQIASDIASLEQSGAVIIRSDDANLIATDAVGYAGELGMTNLIVEGGAEILGSFFDANLIDQCEVYIGGKVVGSAVAPGPVAGLGAASIQDSHLLALREVARFDDDLKLIYRRI